MTDDDITRERQIERDLEREPEPSNRRARARAWLDAMQAATKAAPGRKGRK